MQEQIPPESAEIGCEPLRIAQTNVSGTLKSLIAHWYVYSELR
jgi:hypothetical protein